MLNRRQFNTLAGGSLGALLTRNLWAEQARRAASPHVFYIALVADSHIIDEFYKPGSENGGEDNESILVTTPRLVAARDLINSLDPPIEQVFRIGDYFHNYPSTDYDSTSRTRRGSTTPRPSLMASTCPSTSASAITTTTFGASLAR